MMTSRFLLPVLGAALFLLAPARLYAPPGPSINTVAIAITGISTNKATLVAVPTLRIAAIETSPDGNTRTWMPGQPSIDGRVVIERAWTSGVGDWAGWFQAASQGQNVRKDVTLTYGGSPGTVVVWRNCVAAKYQILPTAPGSISTIPRERLELLPESMDGN